MVLWRASAVALALAVGVPALAACDETPSEATAADPVPASELFGDGGFISAPVNPGEMARVELTHRAAAEAGSRNAPTKPRPESPVAPTAMAETNEARATPVPSEVNARAGGPIAIATKIATTVFARPSLESRKLGYIRLGGQVEREPEPATGTGCRGPWYRLKPVGFVCGDEVTTDASAPLARAAARRPDLDKPLPYAYGFVRATAPQYLIVPSKQQQIQSEFKLEEHLEWYAAHRTEVQVPFLGANDVPLDARGVPRPGAPLPAGKRLSTQLVRSEVFGGRVDEAIPWWLEGTRKVPNVSGFEVPASAIFADRVRRKTGLSFVDAFNTVDEGLERRFAVTVDLRLIPTTKVKPDSGSIFHGVEITPQTHLPFAFVSRRESTTWKLIKGRDEARPDVGIPWRAIVPLTGEARLKGGKRYYQLKADPLRWIRASDVGVVAPPPEWPKVAEAGEKWVDVSLVQQTLVLYEGKHPFYATLVSTGQDRLGDPKTTTATPRGAFTIQSKHIAAAMDSDENSTVLGGSKGERPQALSAEAHATIDRLRKAESSGTKLSAEDQRRLANINKGRHPEYGVTMRRGSQNYELRDVPWIQYFAAGYALHGSYWHDVFGTPRSHGCINLSPIDARLVFNWTEPAVPDGWHGLNVDGRATTILVRE
jgi:lipoprotein-anchoring transpeptidase ErfK/SrfK